MPRSFYTGRGFWRLFFIYVFIGMILFAAGTLYINNTQNNVFEVLQSPNMPLILTVTGAILLLPFLMSFVKNMRSGVPVLDIDGMTQRITFGLAGKKEWKKVDHEYTFADLAQVEVLRNHEFRAGGGSRGSVAFDSYELNLYFSPDDRWIGVTESRNRQRILGQAEDISRITGAGITDENVTRQRVVTRGREEPDFSAPPPFLTKEDLTPVDRVDVIGLKLRLKLFPFRVRLTDTLGQQLADLLMPVVSHFVNKVGYRKSLPALEYLCSCRYSDPDARTASIRRLVEAGWQGEESLYSTIARIFDARTGFAPLTQPSRDAFERYYMQLNDRLYLLAKKYRIVLIEYLEKIIEQAPDRYAKYEMQPSRLKELQRSENYAFKFIVDIAALVICGFAAAFTVMALRAGVSWGEPGVTAGGVVSAVITITLIYAWFRFRRRFDTRR